MVHHACVAQDARDIESAADSRRNRKRVESFLAECQRSLRRHVSINGDDPFLRPIINSREIQRVDFDQCRTVAPLSFGRQSLLAARFHGEKTVLSFHIHESRLRNLNRHGITPRQFNVAGQDDPSAHATIEPEYPDPLPFQRCHWLLLDDLRTLALESQRGSGGFW